MFLLETGYEDIKDRLIINYSNFIFMVRMFMIICSLCFSYISFAWSPQGNKIKTRWAEQVTVENVWQIYPRPQLKRVNWKNLNGLWKYQVTEMNRKKKDVHYGDEILVPFSI